MTPIDLQALCAPCACGQEHPLLVQELLLGPGVLAELPQALKRCKLSENHPVIVCDENTFEAAGRTVCRLLEGAPRILLPADGLHADEHAVARAASLLPEDTGVLIAVGAGTIHDITRFVAHERKLPFVSVPTAASVDGFVSTVAAMTWHGFKKSFIASSPVLVVADSEVFAKAPARLTASGVCDLLGKYTALADWQIAHLIAGEPICARICALEREALAAVRAQVENIRTGEPQACEALMHGLLLSGLAMQMTGSSRPASGAEHHLSHFWEMEAANPHLDAYHGEKVGVGLVLCAREYAAIRRAIRAGSVRVRAHAPDETERLRAVYGTRGLYGEVRAENEPDPLAGITDGAIESALPAIADILDGVPDADTLADLIRRAGGPCMPADIGLDPAGEEAWLSLSPYVRRRLTLMRLKKRLTYSNPPAAE